MSDQQLQDEQAMADMDYSEPALPLSEAWKGIIRPVTIFQILHADPSPFFEDKALVIEGRGFSAVVLVAHVVAVKGREGGVSYVLEDGTGRMSAMKDLDSLCHFHGQNPEAEREERAQCLALEHTYVEVIGTLQKRSLKWGPSIKIKSISPVHDYHQVMYHILNVIHCNKLIQQNIQPYSADMDSESDEHLAGDLGNDSMVVDDDAPVIPSPPILPNTFSPQRQQPYAALEPLQRAIMTQMCHTQNTHVSIGELAQIIEASYRCTQFQFYLALQALLTEAYLTSPLDDGYVVLTPRY